MAVVLFGIMGAALSGLLSTARGTRQVPDSRAAARRVGDPRGLAMGAMAAVAVTTFLVSGLLNLGPLNGGLALAAAFASGFSERLITRAGRISRSVIGGDAPMTTERVGLTGIRPAAGSIRPDGIHLRWMFPPHRGFPKGGFAIYRHASKDWKVPCADFGALGRDQQLVPARHLAT